MKRRKIKKKVIKKAPFYVFAEKLLENLAMINKYSECPNCKNEIKKNQIICEKCGQELGNKLTYEENMEYIRLYLHDKMYTQTEINHELVNEIKRFKKIIEENELEDLFGIKKKQDSSGLWSEISQKKILFGI